MLEPYEMSRIIITGSKNLQEKIIKELHKLKILHIVEHSKTDLADIGNPLESANKLSEIIVKVRSLMTALGIKKEENKFKLKKGLLEISQTTKKLNDKVSKNLEELKKIEELISKNQAVMQELEILKNINVPLEAFTPYKSLTYFTGYVKNKNSIVYLKEELSKITNKLKLFESVVEKKTIISLFIDIKSKEDAQVILREVGFSPVNFANISNFKGTASENLIKIENEYKKLENRRDNTKKQIEKLGQDYKGFLITADGFLSQELEKAEAPLKFAVTKDAFLIKGWVPSKQLNNTINRLNKASKNKVFIHSELAKITDKVPVKLKNQKYVEPFEFFMNLYTMPTYKEIDPTFFVFLTFPLLFGFMLGDFGYGLVTLILFIMLKKRIPKAKNFFNILIFASLATIFFGLLFGEFFGYEEIAGFHLPHILSRSHQINELLYLAIAVGIAHINLGLVIGFVNELKSHGFMKALYAKGGWIVLEIGVMLLALSYFKVIILPIYVGVVFFLLSLFMLLKGEGIRGLIELPSIFSNTLSYARLMAIGLSSVKLAEVINDMAAEMFHGGGFLILAGVLILALGHIINIGIGMLGSFLHSLRLHYVEFFTKFFHGGAKKYSPFGAKQ
jgi:V/A-type H+-transporting ATPase subunit I|tara:strand:+ start:14836 stop:16692 length:1857 start_codon:yes stop_codon:yes gene_type:complete